MYFGLLFAWLVTVGSVAGLAWWLVRMILRKRRPSAPWSIEDPGEFSLDRYQPMSRLLADEDLQFLKAQPGYRAAMGVRWKRERLRIFRLYLAELKQDFHRLHAQARELVAHSEADSADLIHVLMKQQIRFLGATTALEFRLMLHQIGIGKIDVAPLLKLIEAMRADLTLRTTPHLA